MQLTKGTPFDDNDHFHEPLLLDEPPSLHHPPFPSSHLQQTVHEDQGGQQGSSELRFYNEFRKIYSVAHHLALEKQRQIALAEGLHKRIKIIQDRMREAVERKNVSKDQLSEENRTKRSRRTAEEIEKKFKCEVTYCERQYGSEGSLQQHIKLKHPELYHKSVSEDSLPAQEDSSL